MYGYIYKISNTRNNKLYIGQTTKSIDLRFKQHLAKADYYVNRYGNDTYKYVHLYLAMNTYGKECFRIEQIDTAENQNELDDKEAYWINFYDAVNTGYNMIPGSTTKANPMSSSAVKDKHDAIMRSEVVRKKISESLKKYRQANGVSEEHRKKLSEAQQNRKCFIKDGKITYTSLNNTQKVNELLAAGWVLSTDYYSKKAKCKDKVIRDKQATKENLDHNPFATRSLACYCILDTGARFDFESILDAGKWWYDNYKPFGDIYSTATYQRKIEASIAGKEIVYGNKTHKKYKKITNIAWYRN